MAAKEKELAEKGESAVMHIAQNIARKSNEQKSEIIDAINNLVNNSAGEENNIDLAIQELDSFIQQFEDTPTA